MAWVCNADTMCTVEDPTAKDMDQEGQIQAVVSNGLPFGVRFTSKINRFRYSIGYIFLINVMPMKL